MTKSAPEFDAEKRRRWYAAVMGTSCAAAFIGSMLLNFWFSGNKIIDGSQPLWGVLITIFGFWFFFEGLWGLHKATYGVPYLIAAIIGWFYARKAPDARDSF